MLCFGLHIYILTPLPGPLEDGPTYDSIIISYYSLDLTIACEFDDSKPIISCIIDLLKRMNYQILKYECGDNELFSFCLTNAFLVLLGLPRFLILPIGICIEA